MVVFKSSKTKKTGNEKNGNEKRLKNARGLLGGTWRGWARAKISTLAHVGDAGPNPRGDEKGLCFCGGRVLVILPIKVGTKESEKRLD